MARRGKLLFFTALAAAIAVLGAAGYQFRSWPIEEWMVHQLRTGTSEEKLEAARSLAERGVVRAIPDLLVALSTMQEMSDAESSVRVSWLLRESIRKLTVPSALPHFLRAILLADGIGCGAALDGLEALGDQSRPAARDLAGALPRLYPGDRLKAAALILKFEPENREAIAALGTLLSLPDNICYQAMELLELLGPRTAAAWEPGFRNPKTGMRKGILLALARRGPRGREILPSLREAMGKERGILRVLAAHAVARIDPEDLSATPAILEGLGLEDTEERQQTARLLSEMPSLPALAAPALIAAARADDWWLRYYACRALGRVDPTDARAAGVAVALRERAMVDPEPSVRREARLSLEALGEEAPPPEEGK